MRVAGVVVWGRANIVGFLFGAWGTHQLAPIPSGLALGLGLSLMSVLLGLVWLRWRLIKVLNLGLLLCSFWIGLSYASVWAHVRLADQLPLEQENRIVQLRFVVQGLVESGPNSRRFVAKILSSQPEGVPTTALISWYGKGYTGPYFEPKVHDFPDLRPGQVWQANATVKTPHGSRNEAGFDYERHLFTQGIRVLANLRGVPKLEAEQWSEQPRFSTITIALWRSQLRDRLTQWVQDYRYGGVITALSLGDQAAIDQQDWTVFNRAGLTHLVSISGTHIGLVAGLVAGLFGWGWRRLSWRSWVAVEHLPAQYMATYVAVGTALAYSLIAGWGVPAQRSFLMLAIALLSRLWRVPLKPTQVMSVAAILVVLMDPWALLSAGFWLSFGAISVLLACLHWAGQPLWVQSKTQRWKMRLSRAISWQIVISLLLCLPLAWWFNEVSVVSPLTNLYAIPILGLLVTPLSLLSLAISSLGVWPEANQALVLCTHRLIEWVMVPTTWLVQQPWASLPVAQAPSWVYALGGAGVMWALLPHASHLRYLGWLALVPVLFWPAPRLQTGEWRLDALDVGQGGAVLIRTRHSSLLFDTGLRFGPYSDAATQTILPFLRSQGLSSLDYLVISHADLDHVGGTLSLLEQVKVWHTYSNFDLVKHLNKESRYLKKPPFVTSGTEHQYCQKGGAWEIDEVRFEFIWPSELVTESSNSAARNANSCVLRIQGPYHSALLTGDIGKNEEYQLLEQGLKATDVVMVPHHGSLSSSSAYFVRAMQAQYAIAQQGWWNRFSHPAVLIEQRWRHSGAQFYRSDYHGGISLWSKPNELIAVAQRVEHSKYWQHPLTKGSHPKDGQRF